MKKFKNSALVSLIAIAIIVLGYFIAPDVFIGNFETEANDSMKQVDSPNQLEVSSNQNVSLSDIPEYTSEPYVAVNGNKPFFTEEELVSASYEKYAELDALGRCGVAISCIGKDIMPTEERESIGNVKPTGWQTAKYDNVDGKYLYNRCHLIGFQLTGENANKNNLITGTRYLNVQGMLPFENMVADYVKETGNHVLYRVTPIFEGENLVASGVLMEARSVEDNGEGIEFNVYCYNVQPGIEIDYTNGNSCLTKSNKNIQQQEADYVLNTGSKKIHLPNCSSVKTITEENKVEYHGTKEDLISQGYTACGSCKP